MATSNPSYVRLVDKLTGGMCADLTTGWSIAGYDVKQFPEDPDEGQFVRSKLYEGVLEAASKAEFDEIQDANRQLAENRPLSPNDNNLEQVSAWQENVIQQQSKAVRKNLKKARAADAVDKDYDPKLGRPANSLLDADLDPEEESQRREATIKERKKANRGRQASDNE